MKGHNCLLRFSSMGFLLPGWTQDGYSRHNAVGRSVWSDSLPLFFLAMEHVLDIGACSQGTPDELGCLLLLSPIYNGLPGCALSATFRCAAPAAQGPLV
jgi:hypothetical protein